jgi:hypothetical protein
MFMIVEIYLINIHCCPCFKESYDPYMVHFGFKVLTPGTVKCSTATVNNFVNCGFVAPYYKIVLYT